MPTTAESVSADAIPAENLSADTSLDTEGAQLRELAQKADSGEVTQEEIEGADVSEESTEDSAKKSEDRTADTADTDSPETSAAGPRRGPDGKFLPKAATPAPKTETAPKPGEEKAQVDGQQPPTELTKEQKDAARLDRSWKALEREKAMTRAREQQVAQREQHLQRAPDPAQQPRFSAKDLSDAANVFEQKANKAIDEGDADGAKENLKLASEARTAAYQSNQAEAAIQRQEFERTWEANCAQVVQENPELADPTSEMSEDMHEILAQHPILTLYPNGFRDAAEAIKLKRGAAEVSGLRDENTKLQKELKQLRERTSLSGSGPVPRAEPGNLEGLSLEEQGQVLRDQLRAG